MSNEIERLHIKVALADGCLEAIKEVLNKPIMPEMVIGQVDAIVSQYKQRKASF